MTQEPAAMPSEPVEALTGWRAELAPRLADGEQIQGVLETDLDSQLRFAAGLVVVTDRRLASRDADGGWILHDFTDGLTLKHKDHAGVGTLELSDAGGRIAVWRFTLGANPAAIRLAGCFQRQRDGFLAGRPAEPEIRLCPKCQVELAPGEDVCSACAAEVDAPPSTWTLFRIWRFAKPYKGPLLAGFLLTVLSTGATLVPPYLTMPIMDNVLIPYQDGAPMNLDLVGLYLGGLLAASIAAWALGWARTYLLSWVSEKIAADLRTNTFEHLMGLSLEYFGAKRTGDLIARISSESDRICLFLSVHLLDFATDVLMMAMTAFILISIDPWLAIAALVPLPLIAWSIQIVRHRLRAGFDKADRVWGEITNVLADSIPGVRVVKAFAQEAREVGRFRVANQHNFDINNKTNRLWALFSPTVSLLTEIGLLVVWAVGIWLVAGDDVTVGVLTAFIAYIGRFYSRLDSMSRMVSTTQRAAAGAKRIFDILDHVSKVPEPENPVSVGEVKGAISLENVGFRYGNRAVTKGVSLDIHPGEMVGLVGHSGSGKSTLVNLICRFYDVSEGAIRLDGTDLRDMRVADYRRNIGLVLQEPFLFFGTVAENIAYGRPEATRSEIVAAARAAHAHEFILRLPQGYDSLVGERGQGLSGGERQRISIARALLIDPKILILDEATSSVDTETEKEIQKALDNLVKGRTTIAIAHRLSTLRMADRLVVMDRGEIVEVGPHDELMEKEGAYFRLYQAQARNVDTDIDDRPWNEVPAVAQGGKA